MAAIVAAPVAAQTAPAADRQSVEAQINELRAMRDSMAKQMSTFDGKINALEAQLQAQTIKSTGASPPVATAAAPPAITAPAPTAVASAAPANGTILVNPNEPSVSDGAKLLQPKTWGTQEPYKGFVLARTDRGEVDMTVVAYFRYLNQNALEPTYTDYFGRKTTLDLKQDFQFNKVNLTFKGWLYDERLRWLVFLWTNNATQGDAAQVVIAGNFTFRFSKALTLGAGINSVPSTRSLTLNYPNWLRNDNRLMADEFFRGSFTTGVWIDGFLGDKVQYEVMVANNLSQLGVSAAQLSPSLNTASGYVRWMPSTGEFGPLAGFGDYENHQELATLFEAHYTYSREDAQEQPSTNAVENSQIRLSDGTRIFDPNIFGTQYRIRKATYQMAAVDAGVKYRGYALEGEAYARWVNDFETTGPLPYSKLFDTGISLQASAMLVESKLQAFTTFSQIWGEFGDPTEVAVGLNWYPFATKGFRISPNALWLDKSPVGYSGVPYVVGGQGWVFYVDAAIAIF